MQNFRNRRKIFTIGTLLVSSAAIASTFVVPTIKQNNIDISNNSLNPKQELEQTVNIRANNKDTIGKSYFLYHWGYGDETFEWATGGTDIQSQVKKPDWYLGNFNGHKNWDEYINDSQLTQDGAYWDNSFWKIYWNQIMNWQEDYWSNGYGATVYYTVDSLTKVTFNVGFYDGDGHKHFNFYIERFKAHETVTNIRDSSSYNWGLGTNKYPSEYKDTTDVSNKISSGIINGYDKATPEVTFTSFNNREGTINAQVKIKKATDYKGNQVDLGPYNISIYGFRTHQPTTISNGSLLGAGNIDVGIVTNTQIAEKLPSSSLIKESWENVTSNDLEVQILDKKPLEGKVICNIKIKNKKACDENGNPQQEITYQNVELFGLKASIGSVMTTNIIDCTPLGITNLDTDAIKNNNQIKELIISKISNPGANISTNNIIIDDVIKDKDNDKSLSINISITNGKWIGEDGNPVNTKQINGIQLIGLGSNGVVTPSITKEESSNNNLTYIIIGVVAAAVLLIIIIVILIVNKKNREGNKNVNSKLTKLLAKQSTPPKGLSSSRKTHQLEGPTGPNHRQRQEPINGMRSKLGTQDPMGPVSGMRSGVRPGHMGSGMVHGMSPGPQRPAPRSSLGAQKPGMRPSVPPHQKIEINGPSKSLAPKKRM